MANLMLSLKVVTISASVFFIAVLLKLFLPVLLTDFALSDLPSTLNAVASWLRPPYLYLVINCIIITIVATSKLQSKFDHYAIPPPPVTQPIKSTDDVMAFDHYSFSPSPIISAPAAYGGVAKPDDLVVTAASPLFDYEIEKVSEFNLYGNEESENKNIVVTNKVEEMKLDSRVFKSEEKVTAAAEDNYVKVVLNSSSPSNKVSNRAPTTEFSKPPASSRFSHRKVVKTTPEGGKTLRVTKPKRHETLESTWKTITDGRPMPLTRHLRKSDTWEPHPPHSTTAMKLEENSTMTKSETFSSRKKNSTLLSRSSGSGKLKKDPSLSQDELNKRVEAFITKFNQDMMLQRQESLNQYMEMINRGAGP